MIDRLALSHRHRAMLETLHRVHVSHAEVWAYGSRVNGTSHDASDLDLAVRGPDLRPVGQGFYALLEALEQSNLPILVQAHDWTKLPVRFHRETERNYVVAQRGRIG